MVFAIAAFIYLFFANWLPQEADAEVGFQATRAVALRGEYYLSPDTPSARMILDFKDPVRGDAYNCRVEEGGVRQFPYWGLAYISAGVPLYYAGHALDVIFKNVNVQFETQQFGAEGFGGSEYFARLFVFSLQPLAAAGAVALLFMACRRAGAEQRSSILAAVAFGFATHFAVQARSGLSDSQAVFVVALVLERALAARESGRWFEYLTVGAATGLGLLTKIHTVFAVAPLPLLALWRPDFLRTGIRGGAAMLAGLAPFIIIFAGANAVRWGSPWITGYEKSTAQGWFRIDPWLGLKAMVTSPSKGMFVYAFALLVPAACGFVYMLVHRRVVMAGLTGIAALGAILMPASTIEWHGSWAFGPRYALVALPLLGIPAAFGFHIFSGRLRVVPFLLIFPGAGTIAPAMITSPFGAMDVAMQGARVRWPDNDPSFPAGYDEGSRNAERFMRLCLLNITDPLNFMNIQHALGRAAIAGRAGLSIREDLQLSGDGFAEPPARPEYRGFGSIGWVGYRQRFDGGGAALFVIMLAQGGIVYFIVRCVAGRHVP